MWLNKILSFLPREIVSEIQSFCGNLFYDRDGVDLRPLHRFLPSDRDLFIVLVGLKKTPVLYPAKIDMTVGELAKELASKYRLKALPRICQNGKELWWEDELWRYHVQCNNYNILRCTRRT